MIFYYPAICKIFVEHLPNRTANNNKTKRFILQFGINSDSEKHKYTNYYAKSLILQKPTRVNYPVLVNWYFQYICGKRI